MRQFGKRLRSPTLGNEDHPSLLAGCMQECVESEFARDSTRSRELESFSRDSRVETLLVAPQEFVAQFSEGVRSEAVARTSRQVCGGALGSSVGLAWRKQQPVTDEERTERLNGGARRSTSHSLEGAVVALGDSRTEKMLTDESWRIPEARSPIDGCDLFGDINVFLVDTTSRRGGAFLGWDTKSFSWDTKFFFGIQNFWGYKKFLGDINGIFRDTKWFWADPTVGPEGWGARRVEA